MRELFEETGLVIADPGDPVWQWDFTVEWDNADHDTGHAEILRGAHSAVRTVEGQLDGRREDRHPRRALVEPRRAGRQRRAIRARHPALAHRPLAICDRLEP
ncbi:MAG: hypothetical protein WDM88_08770 [Galbitalea sp.]